MKRLLVAMRDTRRSRQLRRRRGAGSTLGPRIVLGMLAALVALTLVAGVAAAGPVSFAAAVDYGTGAGSGPQSVAVGNLNADSRPDLAVANHNTDKVAVLLQNNDGSFGPAVSYDAGTIPTSVAIGDLNSNQDHRADLVVANANSDDVTVSLGDWSGHFGAPQHFAVHGYPTSVAVANLNPLEDDYADLVVTNLGWGDVSALRGNGDGSFQAAVNYGSDPNAQPSSVAVDDLSGDGNPDLVVADRSDVSVLLGDGHGNFTAKADYAFPGSQLRSVAIGKLAEDALPDAVVADNSACCGGADRVWVLHGKAPIARQVVSGWCCSSR